MAAAAKTGFMDAFMRLPMGQRIGYGAALAAGIAGVVSLWMWSQQPSYKLLYSGLTDRDGGDVVAALDQQNIPYQFTAGGAILVPDTQVHSVRLKLAAQGLPRGGGVGFEIMEKQRLGTSQFLEQVNFQRALEGELARSIQTLTVVSAARVHLAIPKPTVFVREQTKPTASVVVSLAPGRNLEPGQVTGIVNLVARSVPNLSPDNVTVLDQGGALLSARDDALTKLGLDPAQLRHVRDMEAGITKRIESILAPIVGIENVRAQVTAELDFTQTEQVTESYKPNRQPDIAVRSESLRQSQSGQGGAQGVPGALTNQPPQGGAQPQAPAAQGAQSNQNDTTTNFELDKTISHIKRPTGLVKRLTVAVVINHKTEIGPDGEPKQKAYKPEEIAKFQDLVKEAMGFTADRNDSVTVVNSPFRAPEPVPPPPIWKDPEMIDLARTLGTTLGSMLAGLIFVLGFLKFIKGRAKATEEVSGGEGGSMNTAAFAFQQDMQIVRQMAIDNPQIFAEVLKEWAR